MLIPSDNARDFLRIYLMLMRYAGQQRDIIPAKMSEKAFLNTSLQTKVDCRDAIYQPKPLLEDFIAHAGDKLSSSERDEILDWKRYVDGQFILLKHLKKSSIFLNTASPAKAYAVLSLTSDLLEMIPYPPVVLKTVLLPFRGVVLCDGLLTGGLLIGPNMRRDLNETYMELKRAGEIIKML